jgi:hypothetical protein
MSDQPQVSVGTPLSVVLTVAQWRAVLETLANGPYRVVAPLMNAIEQQANAMIARMQPQQRANGEDQPNA